MRQTTARAKKAGSKHESKGKGHKVHRVEARKADNGGFIVTHHHEQPEEPSAPFVPPTETAHADWPAAVGAMGDSMGQPAPAPPAGGEPDGDEMVEPGQ